MHISACIKQTSPTMSFLFLLSPRLVHDSDVPRWSLTSSWSCTSLPSSVFSDIMAVGWQSPTGGGFAHGRKLANTTGQVLPPTPGAVC